MAHYRVKWGRYAVTGLSNIRGREQEMYGLVYIWREIGTISHLFRTNANAICYTCSRWIYKPLEFDGIGKQTALIVKLMCSKI